MGVEQLSDEIILVKIDNEHRMDKELQYIVDTVSEDFDCDVVVDFPLVSTISATTISALLGLKKTLEPLGRRLILSSISAKTRGILSICGLGSFFEITNDHHTALSKLRLNKQP